MARLTPVLGAACAGLLLASGLSVQPTASAGAAAAPSCPEAILYVARDAGEASGANDVGAFGSRVVEVMAPEIRVPHEVVGLRYRPPSVSLLRRDPHRYVDAVARAAAELTAAVAKDRSLPCQAGSELSFLGYGVGAWVVHAAMGMLDPGARDHVRSVVVVGDPAEDSKGGVRDHFAMLPRRVQGMAFSRDVRRVAPRSLTRRFPKAIRSSVVSYCVSNDPYCWTPRSVASEPLSALTARLRSQAARHAFYTKHRMYWGIGKWLAQRTTKKSLRPHLEISGSRTFRIGQPGSLTVSARGANPPFTISLRTPDLDGTGLVSSDATISGTPTRKLRLKVRATVVDAVGRVTDKDFTLRVDYPDATTRVVTEDNGQDSSGYVVAEPSVSTGGHLVALASGTDLVAADTNQTTDIYLKDMDSGSITLISGGAGGGPSDAESYAPSISADGTVIVFASNATNLTSDARPGVFAYQVGTGQLSWLGDGDYPSVSADGTRVAFNDYSGVQVTDLSSGLSTTHRVPNGIGSPQISGDGEKVVYLRYSEDDYDGRVELLDLTTSKTTIVSTRSDGSVMDFDTWAPSIDFDGNVVAFAGSPEGPGILGSVYEKDLVTGHLTRVQHYVEADKTSLSASGQNLAYGILTCSGDYSAVGYYNSEADDLRIVYDRRAARGAGGDAVPSISSDGRYVVFASVPNNGPVDVVIADVIVP